ncbi:MAG: thiamine pyrophosphate-dependent dehydrogenase E1 component subunit alpha [Pacificimonas sp.]|jgi:pyruvate dehydrogenase E1 component alpha subunit|nr:thiamine pyrophosphate-dependent dehydrogenase E1 component subunit alpha [Pacificimonas sp.]
MSLVNEQAVPDPTTLMQMYERMLLIRKSEEKLGELFAAGELPGGVHLYIGQEASGVGVCTHLNDSDAITSTHRGHGHYLAKGGELRAMIAEIYGKADGVCGGMGGSMHVADVSKGILGANGIVGGGFGIAAGAAWAARLDNEGAVAVCFIGDGAANQGTFMEALNIATLWKLPLVIVCENNGWSEYSATETVTAGELGDRARAFKIPVYDVDGNDVVAVWRAAGTAISRARSGDGPSFIETRTYRLRGHTEAEVHFLSEDYRTEAEIAKWSKRDPLDFARQQLRDAGVTDDTIAAAEDRVAEQVTRDAEAAATGDAADPGDVARHMFHQENC